MVLFMSREHMFLSLQGHILVIGYFYICQEQTHATVWFHACQEHTPLDGSIHVKSTHILLGCLIQVKSTHISLGHPNHVNSTHTHHWVVLFMSRAHTSLGGPICGKSIHLLLGSYYVKSTQITGWSNSWQEQTHFT